MAEPDPVNIDFLRRRLLDLESEARRASVQSVALISGGGGGTSGGMEARVEKLENDMREVKADTRAIRDTLIRIEGKLDTKASATDLGMLSGKLNDKPDTWKVVVIVLALGAIMGGSQLVKALADAFRPSQAAISSSAPSR